MVQLAEARQTPLWQPVLENEMLLSGQSEQEIWARLETRYDIMCRSAQQALTHAPETGDSLIHGLASAQYAHAASGNNAGGSFMNLVMARALSCSESNAAFGKICAAPTAGSCGILPAVLISVGERYTLEKQDILRGLMTASGLGAVVMRNATVAGAEGGCQAECGVAAAMAAAATAQMAGGTIHAALDAFGFALMNCMGLVCDPIAGLVQVPCAQRNASQAMNAILSADMALAGNRCLIPPDEMIDAMYRVGQMLPAPLRETALGGIAATPTAKEIARRLAQQ